MLYEDGTEERLRLTAAPWDGSQPPTPADVDRAKAALWRPAGRTDVDSGAALLGFDPA